MSSIMNAYCPTNCCKLWNHPITRYGISLTAITGAVVTLVGTYFLTKQDLSIEATDRALCVTLTAAGVGISCSLLQFFRMCLEFPQHEIPSPILLPLLQPKDQSAI